MAPDFPKRFITVANENEEYLMKSFKSAAVGASMELDVSDIYKNVKSKLSETGISYDDWTKLHPDELPQGGYTSIYFDYEENEWKRVKH